MHGGTTLHAVGPRSLTREGAIVSAGSRELCFRVYLPDACFDRISCSVCRGAILKIGRGRHVYLFIWMFACNVLHATRLLYDSAFLSVSSVDILSARDSF